VRSFTLPTKRSELETDFSNNCESGVPNSNYKDAMLVKGQVNFLKPTAKIHLFSGAFAKIAKSDSLFCHVCPSVFPSARLDSYFGYHWMYFHDI
jgi:hypothetical protein